MEWNLKTSDEKKSYSFMLFYSSLIYGFGSTVLIFGFLTYLDLSPIDPDSEFDLLLFSLFSLFSLFCIPFSLLFYFLLISRQKKDIKKSNLRLESPIYREKLIKVGLLYRVENMASKENIEEKRKKKNEKLWGEGS